MLTLTRRNFFGILADVCKQVSEFSNCPVHIVIKLLVAKQLAGRAFTTIQAPDDVIDPPGHLIEPVIQLLVGEQLAHRALALVQAARRRLEVRHGAGKGPGHRFVIQEPAQRALSAVDARGHLFQVGERPAQRFVGRRIVHQAAHRALALIHVPRDVARGGDERVQLVVERVVRDELAERAPPGAQVGDELLGIRESGGSRLCQAAHRTRLGRADVAPLRHRRSAWGGLDRHHRLAEHAERSDRRDGAVRDQRAHVLGYLARHFDHLAGKLHRFHAAHVLAGQAHHGAALQPLDVAELQS